MVGNRGNGRGTWDRAAWTRSILLVVVVALVGGTVIRATTTSAPDPSDTAQASPSGSSTSPAPASPAPDRSAGPSDAPVPEPSPTAEPTGWAELDVPPRIPVATFAPTRHGVAAVALDTAFRLTSLDGTPVEAMAGRLGVEPRIAMTRAAPDGDSITIRPARPLAAGETYRFTLRRTDGTIAQTWAVNAARDLRVVGSIPADQVTGVPRDTGIEFTFDQAGVTAAAVEDRFTIRPRVRGRFEVRGRVVAFVPTTRLKAATLYTVTLAKGLPLRGTGQTLLNDVVIRFETRAPKPTVDPLAIRDPLVDSAIRARPTIGIDFLDDGDERNEVPRTLRVAVHRLPGLTDAMTAYDRLLAAPDWATSAGAPIATGDLPRVLSARLTVHRALDTDRWPPTGPWIQLPEPLPRGWYVLTATHGGVRQQVLIQVTDVSAYAQVSETKSAVWVNAVRTGRPVAGASLTLDGTGIGKTDGAGLRIAATPASARTITSDARGALFLVVRDPAGRRMFLAMDRDRSCDKCWYDTTQTSAEADAWWHALAVDRQVLRSTDSANAWGVIKARDDGSVPRRVELRLQAWDPWMGQSLPIASTTVVPAATGMFAADLAFTDVPAGDYDIAMLVDGVQVGSTWVQIGPITKPSYGIEVASDRHAVIEGTKVPVTATASFFEGTPVTGVELDLSPEQEEEGGGAVVTTDDAGTATGTLAMRLDDDSTTQWRWVSVYAHPTLPEESDIAGRTSVAVFRSSAIMDAEAQLDGTRLTVDGRLRDVDFARMEAEDQEASDPDPGGAPRADGRVTLSIIEITTVRQRVGTSYDFITKRTAPVYRYDQREATIGTREVVTDAAGRFRMARTVRGGTHEYRVDARYTDEAGRTIQVGTYAWARTDREDWDGPRLLSADAASDVETPVFGIGERVRVTMLGGHPKPAADRYLFTLNHRGLQDATGQDGPTLAVSFAADWVPDIEIGAVRFTGTAYEVVDSPFIAAFDTDTRRLQVDVRPDAARYAPGGTVRLAVRTRDAAGEPVPASVVVRVIDEKLYAIAAATEVDLMSSLYVSVPSGIVTTGWSHRPPTTGFDGGDTGGGDGGDREDFRDWLLFKLITTGADGRATVTVDLSDDLTSWRATATALDGRLQVGDAVARIPVGLPFFAEAVAASEYLVGDEPVVRLRAYGSALRSGDAVTFTVSAPTLGLADVTISAKAFEAAGVPLPALTEGTHRLRITASASSGPTALQDVLVRTVKVVTSRTTQQRTSSGPLTDGFRLRGGTSGLTTILLTDAGRGRSLPILMDMLAPRTGRTDEALAAAVAAATLRDTYGLRDVVVRPPGLDLEALQSPEGSFAVVAYGSADLEVSALAAFVDDPAIDGVRLTSWLRDVQAEEAGRSAKSRLIQSLAGLAALDEPVIADIRTLAASPKRTVPQRAWLALGALGAGDEDLAGRLERELLADQGERLGPWVRVTAGSREATRTTTALLAIVAAGLGDPLAADMDAFVAANPPSDTLVDLERALAARSWAERMPGEPAIATLTVDGATRRIAIDPGEPTSLTLTPAQVVAADLTPVSGSVVVTSRWDGPLDATSVQRAGVTSLERSVSPSGVVPIDGRVVVEYVVRFGPDADSSCWRVTDFVPSGLAPISERSSSWQGWYDDEDAVGGEPIAPWRVVGQRVDFCVSPPTDGGEQRLRYVARVVTPGTYRWEPALIQSSIVTDRGIVLTADDLVIRGR